MLKFLFRRFCVLKEKIFCVLDAKIPSQDTARFTLRSIYLSYLLLFAVACLDLITYQYNYVSFRPLIGLAVCFAALFAPKKFTYIYCLISSFVFAICFSVNFPDFSGISFLGNVITSLFAFLCLAELCLFVRFRNDETEADREFMIKNFSPKDDEFASRKDT